MLSKHPEIAQPADGGAAGLLGHQVFRLLAFITDTLDNDIYLGRLETRQEHIEAQINKTLKFDREDIVIPACLLGKTIIRKNTPAKKMRSGSPRR